MIFNEQHEQPIPLTAHEERAWERYCQDTAGSMDVRDYWSELSPEMKEHWLDKTKLKIIDHISLVKTKK